MTSHHLPRRWHQASPRRLARCARSDWCASAISISSVAPTRARTRRCRTGTRSAAARRRVSGSVEVKHVRRQERMAEQPGAGARGRREQQPDAHPAHRTELQMRSSTQRVPPAMYCRMKPIAIVMPATKPPPGRSWPRRSRYSANIAITGNISAHDDGRHSQVVRGGPCARRAHRCCGGGVDALGRRPEAAQQRIDSASRRLRRAR